MSEGTNLLSTLLADVTVEEPLHHGRLQVFALLQPNGHAPGYALVDDLLDRGEIQISEITEGGAVPTILVLNHSTRDALILDGTELRGAKQNRMVNVTLVVGAQSETAIPVSCVEQGRWAYRSRHFASSKRTVASKLRNRKAFAVAASLARCGAASADQEAVWRDVGDYLDKGATASSTVAMDDLFVSQCDRRNRRGPWLAEAADAGGGDPAVAGPDRDGGRRAKESARRRRVLRDSWPRTRRVRRAARRTGHPRRALSVGRLRSRCRPIFTPVEHGDIGRLLI